MDKEAITKEEILMAVAGLDKRVIAKPFHTAAFKSGEKYKDRGKTKGEVTRADESMEIEDLWGHHHEVARLHLLGYSINAIAEQLGLSNITVKKIVALPAVRDKISNLHAARDESVIPIAQRLRDLSTQAVERYSEFLNTPITGEDPRFAALQLSAAKDVLDRTGHTPVRKSVTVNKHEITETKRGEIIMQIAQRAAERGVIELKPIETDEGED